MMFKNENYRYGESSELQAQLLEMSYEDGDTSMVIFLPNEIDSLEGVLQKLADGYDLIPELDEMFSMQVNVSLPKFETETEIDLTTVLPQLGIRTIFASGNNVLNKILNTGDPLYVSMAVQKAYIEVNEEGAEAAAATGMQMMVMSALPLPPRFHADHPFLYLLVGPDRVTLLMGVYRGN